MIAGALILASCFIALSLACAMWIGRRRDTPADPFSLPFGEMPQFTPEQLRRLGLMRPAASVQDNEAARPVPRPVGFSAAQLRRIAPVVTHDPLRRSLAPRRGNNPGGLALRPDAGGGRSFFPSGQAAVRSFLQLFSRSRSRVRA